MPLSAKSTYLLNRVEGNPELYGTLDCARTVERMRRLLTTDHAELLARVDAFNRDGLYVLTLDVGAGVGAETFQHFVGILCVDSETTIYQAWVNYFGLSTWLLGPEVAPNLALQACINAYSPASAVYRGAPAAQFLAWSRALLPVKTQWNACHAVEPRVVSPELLAALTAAFGVTLAGMDLMKARIALAYPIEFKWEHYVFTADVTAALAALAPPPPVVVHLPVVALQAPLPPPPPPPPPPAGWKPKCCVIL